MTWRVRWLGVLVVGGSATCSLAAARAEEGPVLLGADAAESAAPLVVQPRVLPSSRRVARDSEGRTDLQNVPMAPSQVPEDFGSPPEVAATQPDAHPWERSAGNRPTWQQPQIIEPSRRVPGAKSPPLSPDFARMMREDSEAGQPGSNQSNARTGNYPAPESADAKESVPKRRLFSGDRLDQFRNSARAQMARLKPAPAGPSSTAERKTMQGWLRGGQSSEDSRPVFDGIR